MGRLRYGYPERQCELDDRTLAHLAVVIFDELRRGEGFSVSLPGDDEKTLWVSRGVPLRFDFDDSARISINREWVLTMQRTVHSVHALSVVAEPVRPPGSASRTLKGTHYGQIHV